MQRRLFPRHPPPSPAAPLQPRLVPRTSARISSTCRNSRRTPSDSAAARTTRRRMAKGRAQPGPSASALPVPAFQTPAAAVDLLSASILPPPAQSPPSPPTLRAPPDSDSAPAEAKCRAAPGCARGANRGCSCPHARSARVPSDTLRLPFGELCSNGRTTEPGIVSAEPAAADSSPDKSPPGPACLLPAPPAAGRFPPDHRAYGRWQCDRRRLPSSRLEKCVAHGPRRRFQAQVLLGSVPGHIAAGRVQLQLVLLVPAPRRTAHRRPRPHRAACD